MKIALCAKEKLGFITGKVPKPPENSAMYEKWRCIDCMVISWLLNLISKKLVELFICTPFAKDLWSKLEQRFGD
uniref:Retrotransposon Copia-like N-terminal domain-containing protein n=1 Tax=Manihot esculenta TaxID=3983 RepID=A0A2C9W6F3_MANES